MKTLAYITQGTSDYEPRLRALLEATGIDAHEFEGLEWFGLTPFFVICGASLRPDAHTHGDHVHTAGIHVEVAEELEEAFYFTLPEILADAYADEE